MSFHDVRDRVSTVVFGERLKTAEISHQTASNPIALAVLASDALSSVAYATEEILIILNTAALGGFALLGFTGNAISIPIAIAISMLIAIVTISYRQTIFSNPAGSQIRQVVVAIGLPKKTWAKNLHRSLAPRC